MPSQKKVRNENGKYFFDLSDAGPDQEPVELKNYRDLSKILTPQQDLFGKIKYPSAVVTKGKNAGDSFGFEWFKRYKPESSRSGFCKN